MKIGNAIYFDYQASTPLDERVFSEMAPYLRDLFGNPHSAEHCIGWKAAQAVDNAAARVAQLIGADANEIIFTSGATEANNLALLGLGRHANKGKRRRILVSKIEHKSVLATSRVLQEQLGYEVNFVPVDAWGRVDMSALEDMLAEDVLLVSIMAVNNEIGTIQDTQQLSELIRKSGALFHCDAAQAPCAIDLHKFSSFVDTLSLSGHKMYGPQGIGALYIRHDLQTLVEPLIFGGGQQLGLRSGTVPVALCVGMGAAATIFHNGAIAEERALIRKQRDMFVRRLMGLQWPIHLNGPKGTQRHPGNANICFNGFDSHEILNTLQPRLAASTGSACASGIPETSYVLRAIGLTNQEAESSIRFSIGRKTTDAELHEAIEIIEESLSKLSSI